MKDFRNLIVWGKAHRLALEVYRATGSFPREERYGLCSQIRRSAVSFASNNAEACGRGTDADFARLLQIAMGSASELAYQLLLSHDLGVLAAADYAALHEAPVEVKRMLAVFVRRLNADR